MGSLGLGAKQRNPHRAITPGNPTICRSAEAQLRAARVEIDREKLHTVVDHPFFNSLRFKELEMRLITLEFTGDGRFAYCERGLHGEMTIYEGVLTKPSGTSLRFTGEGVDEDELEQQDTSGPSTEAGDCAAIEGRATVRYERGEVDGSPYLKNVERGEFRFAITVKPCFKSTEMEAWVQPLFLHLGQRQTRKHLALVDASGNFQGEAFGEKNLPEIPVRPNSRIGFSARLHLELVAEPKRTIRSRMSTPAGFDGHLTYMQGQRARTVKKLCLGPSSSLVDLRTGL
jgi:hypothetical protein